MSTLANFIRAAIFIVSNKVYQCLSDYVTRVMATPRATITLLILWAILFTN